MELPEPARRSDFVLARMSPGNIAMFRFLLEAYDNLAYFTVLERRPALLKISFAPDSRAEVESALCKMQTRIFFEWWSWPESAIQIQR